ncbi:MAG: hypothetical protein ACXVHB_07855 [Solirubrobacteraceae bacterium]
MRQQVSRLAAQHKLTPSQAQALETGAEQAQARIALDVRPAPAAAPTPPAPTAQPAPAGPPAPGPPGKAKGHQKHGRPDAHGDGNGDGGD